MKKILLLALILGAFYSCDMSMYPYEPYDLTRPYHYYPYYYYSPYRPYYYYNRPNYVPPHFNPPPRPHHSPDIHFHYGPHR